MNEEHEKKETPADRPRTRKASRPRTEPRSWSCFRLNGGRAERLSAATSDGVEVLTWPLEELSFDTIRARWGTGVFRVQYLDERGQPCGRKILKLIERKPRKATDAKPPRNVPTSSTTDSVGAVVALMGLAQNQANVLVQQVRDDAKRTVDREREFMLLAMKHHEATQTEIDRIRREALQPRTPDPTSSAILDAIRALASKVEEGDGYADEPPEVSWLSLARDLAPHCAPGINALLQSIGPALGALMGLAAQKMSEPPKLSTSVPVVRANGPVAPGHRVDPRPAPTMPTQNLPSP
jgi:hypothetical protein